MLRRVVSVVIYIVGFTYGCVTGVVAVAELKAMWKNRS